MRHFHVQAAEGGKQKKNPSVGLLCLREHLIEKEEKLEKRVFLKPYESRPVQKTTKKRWPEEKGRKLYTF